MDPPAKWAKFMPSVKTIKILKAVTEKPIKNEKRNNITNKYPLPSFDYAYTPKLDDDIACIVPKSAKTYDWYIPEHTAAVLTGCPRSHSLAV